MIRLTSRTPAGVANLDYPQNCFYPDGTKDQVAVSAYRQKAIDRLAAYEDTGLEPEEISEAANRRHDCKIDCLLKEYNAMMDKIQSLGGLDHLSELFQAEKDGRLVVLPPNDPLTLEELRKIIEQLEQCDYECEAGSLVMNTAFIRLKEFAYRRKPKKGVENA